MIIENMEQLGKAIDAGEELQHKSVSGTWHTLDDVQLSVISRLVETDRVRTQPKTIYYRVFEISEKETLVSQQSKPFPDIDKWLLGMHRPDDITHIHDFEKSED